MNCVSIFMLTTDALHCYMREESTVQREDENRAMKIIVDADACPVLSETVRIAKCEDVPVVIVGNTTQDFSRYASRGNSASGKRFSVETVNVAVGADSADFEIVCMLDEGDIVVTQDIGLAAMVLGKRAHAIGVRGRIYNSITIESDLELRYVTQKERRQGKFSKGVGPKAFTAEDREQFVESLERVIHAAS